MFKTMNEYLLKLNNMHKYVEIFGFSLIGFFLPWLIGHPQWVVGIVVNTMLILAALNWKGYEIMPLVFLPSLGVLTKGLIFGPFTVFLLYMIPFIWLGNFVIIYCFKKFKIQKKMNYALASIISVLAKVVVIFVPAFVMVYFGILPKMFLIAMGPMQLFTAFTGCFAAYGVYRIQKLAYRS